ncbi:MAG: GYD domain-containing protein [Candidatus Methylacidiphilaceae bacterium]
MTTYIILSRLSPEFLKEPKAILRLAKTVADKIKAECPGVQWKASYATLGRYDIVDIVEAADPKEIEKVVLILRSYAHERTETSVATPWEEFLKAV